MLNMNDCKICGNLVRDPEIKSTSLRWWDGIYR